MNFFVTGGTGFLGSHFLKALTNRAGPTDEIYVLCRTPTTFSDSRLRCVVGNLHRIEEARTYILNSDYVFHLGGEARFRNDLDYDGDNVQPTQKLVSILQESTALKNLVFTSTIGACDRHSSDPIEAPLTLGSVPAPTSRYGQSKLDCERLIQDSHLPFTIIRPTWIYGRGMRVDSHINAFVSLLLKLPLMARFGFPGRVSLIHVDDMCRALVAAIDNPQVIGKIYFGVTENVSLGAVLKAISRRLTGKEIRQIPLPTLHWFFRRFHRKAPLALSNLFVDYLCAQDPKFQSDFGVVNPIDLATGLPEVIAANARARGFYLITGANSGIGLEVARQLKLGGQRLILVDRNVSKLESEFPEELILQADLSDPVAVESVAAAVQTLPLRCLMNIAGLGFKGNFLSEPQEKSLAMIDVNIKGALFLTYALKKTLLHHRTDIVNVASSVAYYPLPGMGVYAATKAFVASWSESLAVELKPTNRVFTISPGGTKTGFQKSAGVKETTDLLEPSQVAQKILANLNGKPKTYIYGLRSKVLALIGRVLPPRRMAALMGRAFNGAR